MSHSARRFRMWPAVLLLAGCGSGPRSYPLPEQRAAIPDPPLLRPFVEMGSYAALAHIVRDVARSPEGVGWRWTYERPEFHFRPAAGSRKFAMDFGIVEGTFAITGPVTMSVWVNGHLLGTMRCERPGDRRFERAVPAPWLTEETTVVAQVDKRWVTPDGGQLGYTLFRMGFVP